MPLFKGARVGPYEIVGLLGAGGMGEVWRARDPRLGRDVAIKILPAELASDRGRRARLEREARAASALNHPNIVTVHELAEADGRVYLVLELVEGRTLRGLAAAGPLATSKLLAVSAQVADGLAVAHTAGIVHRDLKPDNVMITKEGVVKILDFGLARMASEGLPSSAPTDSRLTQEGAVLGTLGYLSPEQASGQPADHRADQFSLGVMLYELVTGRNPFARASPRETLAAVLQETPAPLSRLASGVPAELQRIVERCLAKDPDERYASTQDLARDLHDLNDRAVAPRDPDRPAPQQGARRGTWKRAPIVALLLMAAAWAAFRGLLRDGVMPRDEPRIESVAVLPLSNLSGDPEQDYFADGMTDALITDLAKVGSLRVISRTSAMQYKGTPKPLPQIARELNVDAVVEGSVQRVAGRVRISAQLIHAATDRHLWAESYERDLRDVLVLQGEMARTIAREVAAKLTPDEQARLTHSRPVAPEVYETYLRGVHVSSKRTEADIRKGLGLFERTIDLDPGYAPAHLAVCSTNFMLGFTGWGAIPPGTAMPKAKAACSEALRLDETLAAAHAELGSVLAFYDWDRAAAEASYARGLELGPSDQVALQRYAFFLSTAGRHGEALEHQQRAELLDPLSVSALSNHGWLLYWARQHDRAIGQFTKVLALYPDAPVVNLLLGIVYLQARPSEAVAKFEHALKLTGSTTAVIAQLGHAYALSGRRAEARRILGELGQRSRREYVASYWIAMLQHGLGDDDAALAELEKAYATREALPLLDVEPRWDSLRQDPRFRALQRRAGLAALSVR